MSLFFFVLFKIYVLNIYLNAIYFQINPVLKRYTEEEKLQALTIEFISFNNLAFKFNFIYNY